MQVPPMGFIFRSVPHLSSSSSASLGREEGGVAPFQNVGSAAGSIAIILASLLFSVGAATDLHAQNLPSWAETQDRQEQRRVAPQRGEHDRPEPGRSPGENFQKPSGGLDNGLGTV